MCHDRASEQGGNTQTQPKTLHTMTFSRLIFYKTTRLQ
jgi:hypothetical protein